MPKPPGGFTIYQLFAQNDTLRLLDSRVERFSIKALLGDIPAGHYRIPVVERFAPIPPDYAETEYVVTYAQRHFGPGRIRILSLQPRDVAMLVTDEKARMLGDGRVNIGGQAAPVPAFADARADLSIHGGGERLSVSLGNANFQPLTPSGHGIRVHNAELVKISDFLELRMTIMQLIVLTVLRSDPI